jgi:hypothetical protein
MVLAPFNTNKAKTKTILPDEGNNPNVLACRPTHVSSQGKLEKSVGLIP